MVNTNMHVFKHPKFYEEFRRRAKRHQKELRERNKSDQAISKRTCDGESERASDPGHKHQASSSKGSSEDLRSSKQQASGSKPVKHQAASIKPQA